MRCCQVMVTSTPLKKMVSFTFILMYWVPQRIPSCTPHPGLSTPGWGLHLAPVYPYCKGMSVGCDGTRWGRPGLWNMREGYMREDVERVVCSPDGDCSATGTLVWMMVRRGAFVSAHFTLYGYSGYGAGYCGSYMQYCNHIWNFNLDAHTDEVPH